MGKSGKRKINAGLERWNFIRSYVSQITKQTGKRLNGVELNYVAKLVKDEYFGISDLTSKDIDSFLQSEVPDIITNVLNIPFKDLGVFPYFKLDEKISINVPENTIIRIEAGSHGRAEFNSTNYDYHTSGAKEILESIRKQMNNSSDIGEGNFIAGIFRLPKPVNPKNAEDPRNFFIQYTLFIDGDFVADIKGSVKPVQVETRKVPPSKSQRAKQFRKKAREIKKEVKKRKKEAFDRIVGEEVEKRVAKIIKDAQKAEKRAKKAEKERDKMKAKFDLLEKQAEIDRKRIEKLEQMIEKLAKNQK